MRCLQMWPCCHWTQKRQKTPAHLQVSQPLHGGVRTLLPVSPLGLPGSSAMRHTHHCNSTADWRTPSAPPARAAVEAEPATKSTPRRRLQQSGSSGGRYKPNDPMVAQMKHLEHVDAFSAFKLARDYKTAPVTACVIDTGGLAGEMR